MKQVNTPPGKGNQTEKIIHLLEEQLAHSNQQNKDLAKQIEALTEQVRQLTKLLYGSKTEKSSINQPMDKRRYLMMMPLLACLSTQKNKANRLLRILLYERSVRKKEMIPSGKPLKPRRFTIIQKILSATVATIKWLKSAAPFPAKKQPSSLRR